MKKKTFPKFGNGKGMKKSIPIIREWESEAFILGNGREREFPLTPVLSGNSEIPLRVKDSVCWPRIHHMTQLDLKFHWRPCVWIEQSPCPKSILDMKGYKKLLIFIFVLTADPATPYFSNTIRRSFCHESLIWWKPCNKAPESALTLLKT